MRLKAENCILVNVDFQDRLLPHMRNEEVLVDKVVKLIKGMKALDVPVLTTQQYTKGLGYTDKRIAKALGFENPEELPFIEKSSFSAYDCAEFRERLEASGRKDVIICGIEGHVCVLQTIVDLKAAGYNPVPVSDCISSRTEDDYQSGLRRWIYEKAVPTCFESVLFELCRYSGTPVFKEISALVK
jgi:nicotinamidase-related amidase